MIDFNKLVRDLPGVIVMDKKEHKSYKFDGVLHYNGLTGDINEEFKNDK